MLKQEPFQKTIGKHSVDLSTSIMAPFLTHERKQKIETVIKERTLNYQVAIEGLYDQGNVNAVMRTAESLGYLNFHIIETKDEYKKANRVAQGSDRWLELTKWHSTQKFFQNLKKQGFQIAVSSLNQAISLPLLNLNSPTIFVFGNEKDGVSKDAQKLADVCFKIPMVGMSQSFNISVAAAITLSWARSQVIGQNPKQWPLTPTQKQRVRMAYYQRSLPYSGRLLKGF